MKKVYHEVGKHFLSIGLAVIAFVLIKFGLGGSISLKSTILGFLIWLFLLLLGSILIFAGGEK